MSTNQASILDELAAIDDVALTLRAELDRRTISFRELVELEKGSIIPLSRPTGENIDLFAGNVLIGAGEILVVDGALAVRIAYLRDRAATIDVDEPGPGQAGKTE